MNETSAKSGTGASWAGQQRIVVGVDGSAASLAALRWGVALAGASGCPVTAAYAFTPGYAEVSTEQYAVIETEAEQTLRAWCTDASVAESVDTVVVDGGPDALLSVARPTDLLVLGTRGSYGIARLHLGSVVHHLVHHTMSPVAIVPAHVADHPVTRIVIGVDGSEGSSAAVTFTAGLAAALEAGVVAVYATEPHHGISRVGQDGGRHDAPALVHEWVGPIEASGVAVAVEIASDQRPVEAICRAIGAAPETLAVVGTRGLGGFSGLRLGGVATDLAHSCDVAVVLVPAHPRRVEPAPIPNSKI
ncbi:MAG: universal stress protein [Acidimicrobiia bacterium]